ncbi:MAG: hypothetical protein D3910_26230, partial [Candidatus Electrothrix sp. ATG2]|nr:hypothetical protein [Candidatus Electrothrix sp. ATG2]
MTRKRAEGNFPSTNNSTYEYYLLVFLVSFYKMGVKRALVYADVVRYLGHHSSKNNVKVWRIKKMKTMASVAITAVLATFLAAPCYAAPKEKKPPSSISLQSLQDQIDALAARVTSVENRITVNEGAITGLEEQNADLNILVQQNLTDIGTVRGEITSLQQENAALRAQMSSGAIDTPLQDQIDANKQIIDLLKAAITDGDLASIT